MFGKSITPIVIFLDRGRLQVFAASLGSVATWEIPDALIRDLAVVDKDGFKTQLTSFLGQLKLMGNPAILLLAEALYFAKDIAAASEEERLKREQEFFDMVPCEKILTKTYPAEKNLVAVAICREFIEELQEIFAKVGVALVAIVPLVALGQMGTKRWLDLELGSWATKEVNRLIPLSLTKPQEATSGPAEGETPRTSKRLFLALLAAFGVLLLVLMVMFLGNR